MRRRRIRPRRQSAYLPSLPSEKDTEAFGGYRVKGPAFPEPKRAPLPVELSDFADTMRSDSVNRLDRRRFDTPKRRPPHSGIHMQHAPRSRSRLERVECAVDTHRLVACERRDAVTTGEDERHANEETTLQHPWFEGCLGARDRGPSDKSPEVHPHGRSRGRRRRALVARSGAAPARLRPDAQARRNPEGRQPPRTRKSSIRAASSRMSSCAFASSSSTDWSRSTRTSTSFPTSPKSGRSRTMRPTSSSSCAVA